MNKQIITFDANEQSLIKTGGVDKYSSNKVAYIEAHFNLGENWSGYDSVRAVWFTWYECISTVLDPDGVCIVPYEVLKRTDKVMVNLVGSISEDDVLTDRLTTYPVLALTVDANAKVCGSNTQPITPSEYEQFVEAVKADADRAEEAKEDARGFASSAEISAQNASISETNASTSEDNAKASELNAETYKNQAQTYAQNANNSAISAENAKDEAEDARDTILGMRAEATTLPEGSSATASYNDGVMSFGIPKGDTGATGATGETGATPQLSIGTVETTTEPSVTITGTAENPVLNFGLVKGDKGDTGEVSLADLSTLLPTDTASGAIASFPDGQSVIPALSVKEEIEPIQSGSGTPSPDNVRPISGRTECVTVVSGKNLCDNSVFGTYGLVEQSDGSWYADNNNKIYNKVVWQNDRGIEGQLAIVFKYRYSNADYVGAYPTVYYTDGTRQNLTGTKTTVPTEISTVTRSGKIVDRIVMVYSSNGAQSYVNLMVTEDLTATAYEPYQGHTYTTTLGRTVYGGTLDVVSGELVVDRAMVDLSTLNFNYDSSGQRWQRTMPDIYNYPSRNGNLVAEKYVADVTASAGSEGKMFTVGKGLYIYSTDGTTPPSGNLVYPIATPQTYQLDPTEVDLLLGQNNVWTDCGSVEVTYKADVGLYIDKKLSSNGTRSLSMGLTKSATAEAETEAEPSKTEAETKAEETKTEASKTETETEAVEAKTETDKSETR